MKTIKRIGTLILGIGILAGSQSCKKDKNVYMDDFTATIAENPSDSVLIGTVTGTTEKSFISFSIKSESVSGAFYIEESTGNLYVKDGSLFNYEVNPVITAEVEGDNGKKTGVANITINLTDVLEIPANVGDYRDGGVVFWVDPTDNTKGLVCAVVDQSSSAAEWGCYDLVSPVEITGADGTAIGSGVQNTIDIVNGCTTSGTAADICHSLTLNGFSDWFLPSRDEMNAIYLNKSVLNPVFLSNGGTVLDEGVYYWTSSEYSADRAYDFYFANGLSEGSLKLNYFSVRAIRAF